MSIEYVRWSHALAETETADNPRLWGDSGQAMGRWQMHPSFVQEWSTKVVWGVDWTWDLVCMHALQSFFEERIVWVSDPVRLAMEFHLGVEGVAKGEWDQPYAERFQQLYGA